MKNKTMKQEQADLSERGGGLHWITRLKKKSVVNLLGGEMVKW